MVAPFDPKKAQNPHPGRAFRVGLMISGTLALLAVMGALAFGGPFD